ncbi:MAG: VanZ family protein [Thermodesulfobacteriota bacterium]|nr:VanZ family protein [Thermodesulfobacteriota bacterium]
MAKNATSHLLYYWLPVVLFCAVLFVQSSFSTPQAMPSFPHMDKLLHLGAYAVLGALFLRGFNNSRHRNHGEGIRVVSILLTGIYGATDELHQYYVPFRSADTGDILCDFLGGFIGVYLYHLLMQRYPNLRPI